ncbi:MAG TPA: cation transporter [Caulobacterales bacterium]|nr:cation transporter [Caulobacterales bacterium]
MINDKDLRHAILLVATLNLAYFGVEFLIALKIGSVSLIADSADFFEDAAVNFLILVALGWSARKRAQVGMALAAILLAPAIAFLWTLANKLSSSVPPDPVLLGVTGTGALFVNLFCAFWLARWRHQGGSLTRAAFLSARNDAIANIGIIGAGAVTFYLWPTIWPDVIVGLAIAAMNIDAARAVWKAARDEHRQAPAQP